MSIPTIGASALGTGNQSGGWTAADGVTAVQNFLDYMKETPAQQLEDSWLKAHGLTRQELAAMPPAEQKAILNQMAQDIARELKQKAQDAASGKPVKAG